MKILLLVGFIYGTRFVFKFHIKKLKLMHDAISIFDFFFFKKSPTNSLLFDCPLSSEQFTNSLLIIIFSDYSTFSIQDIFLTTINSTGKCEVCIITLSFKIVFTFFKKVYATEAFQ